METMELESAIPPHLVRERTQPTSLPTPDYKPPVPAYSSRFSTSIQDIVMAIYGAQHKANPTTPSPALSKLIGFVESTNVPSTSRPSHWQLASNTDNTGAYNEIVIAYWKRRSDYEEWKAQSGLDTWWQGLDPQSESNGWFKEIFYPPADRFETVFSSTTTPEGVAHMQDNMSGAIREHVYWGSMRDRLPLSQTNPLTGTTLNPTSAPTPNTLSSRIRVPARQNLTIIRSGQDWSNTTPHERDLYLRTMHPVLIRGMDFLHSNGAEVGCISNRFMSVLDPTTHTAEGVDKTFGLGYFDDLASLENWSKRHKTHLDIFGRFLQYAQELDNEVSLRLFHEVLVLDVAQQEFEYVACHPRTGMMASL